MDKTTIESLCKATDAFYARQHASFASTRKSPWPGWKRCLAAFRETCHDRLDDFSVFDLGCGTLRFEEYLASTFGDARIRVQALDKCEKLAEEARADSSFPPNLEIDFQHVDIIRCLLDDISLEGVADPSPCDLSVAFGLMHHVPTQALRSPIMHALVDMTNQGGLVAVSFWRFADDAAFMAKAEKTHEQALDELGLREQQQELDAGDYLLGWQNTPSVYRYCHSFQDCEISELAASVADRADVIAHFKSDGRTGVMNEYLLLRVR